MLFFIMIQISAFYATNATVPCPDCRQTRLVCGKRKAMMIGESGTGKKRTVYHYCKCANAKKTHACDKKTIGKNKIERRY